MKNTLEQSAAEKLTEIVRKVDATDADLDKRVAALLRAVKRIPEVYAEMMAPHEVPAARLLLRDSQRQERGALWARPTEPDARVAALAAGNSLLDFRLPSGIRLRNATADEVGAAADFYTKQAADMAWKAKWLGQIVGRIKKDKTVGDCLTDADLIAIREKTR